MNTEYQLLFQTGTTYNPNNNVILTKSCRENIFIAMRNSLYNKYSFSQNFYHTNSIDSILTQKGVDYVRLTDQEQQDNSDTEYFQRFHKTNSSKNRLETISYYYRHQWSIPRFFLDSWQFVSIIDNYHYETREIHYKKISSSWNKLPRRNEEPCSYKPFLDEISSLQQQVTNKNKLQPRVKEYTQRQFKVVGQAQQKKYSSNKKNDQETIYYENEFRIKFHDQRKHSMELNPILQDIPQNKASQSCKNFVYRKKSGLVKFPAKNQIQLQRPPIRLTPQSSPQSSALIISSKVLNSPTNSKYNKSSEILNLLNSQRTNDRKILISYQKFQDIKNYCDQKILPIQLNQVTRKIKLNEGNKENVDDNRLKYQKNKIFNP